MRNYVEKNIKPAYEKIPGCGEIEVGGSELREIHVQAIASYLQEQNLLTPPGELKSHLRDSTIVLYGEMHTLEELKRLTLPAGEQGLKRLSEVADVAYSAREKDTISRVDNEERVVLYVQSSGSANLVALSRSLRRETEHWRKLGFTLDIILDSGKKIEESIYNVFRAIAIGIVIVIAFLFLFVRNCRIILILALSLPVTELITTGIMAFFHINLDHFSLAGLSVGIGMIIDTGIVLTENMRHDDQFSSCFSYNSSPGHFAYHHHRTCSSLFYGRDYRRYQPGNHCYWSAAGHFPGIEYPLCPFFYEAEKLNATETGKNASNFYFTCYRVTAWIIKRRTPVFASGLLLIGLLVFCTFWLKKDLTFSFEEDTVFAHVEFDSGTDIFFMDEITTGLAARIRQWPGITRVQAASKPAVSDLMVNFDSRKIKKEPLIRLLNALGEGISHGFLYLPEKSSETERKIEIAIIGDDHSILKELAHSLACSLEQYNWVSRTVLHFKEPPPAWVFRVDHRKAGNQGVTAWKIVNYLRWYLYGPVAMKWTEDNTEIDLRVMGKKNSVPGVNTLKTLTLSGENGERLYLNQLGNFVPVKGTSRIYRQDRQRAAFFTVHTTGFTAEQSAAALWKAFALVPLPRGYAIELDKNVIQLEAHFRFLWAVLGLSLLLIYMVLASGSESLATLFLVLSIVL